MESPNFRPLQFQSSFLPHDARSAERGIAICSVGISLKSSGDQMLKCLNACSVRGRCRPIVRRDC